VALGRAIVRKPQVFLFDEPLSNLDAKLRGQMRVELADLHAQLQTTAIYVTHDQVEAVTLGQRIFVMNDGIVQQVGTGDELYNSPTNVFVASFIGTPQINLVPGRVVEGDGRICVDVDGQSIQIPDASAAAYRPWIGQAVTVGIRPEHLRIGDSAGDGLPVVRAAVRLVENLGSELLVHLDLAGQRIVARLPAETAVRAGETRDVSVAAGRVHLFDPATERRIADGVVPAA
jgi:multiple sugar transport system ATP-binding protein